MKINKSLKCLTILLVLTFIILQSCKREVEISLDKGFSDKINAIISPALLDTLKKKGVVINEGLQPPLIEGIYIVSPNMLLSPYSNQDSYKKGDIFDTYRYKFYSQDARLLSIKCDFKSEKGSDTGVGVGSFISGYGNKFTIFSEEVGVSSNIPYKRISIFSGEITSSGIKDFQKAFIIKEKTGDDNNTKLIPVGTGRVFVDGDGLASKTNVYGGRQSVNTTNPDNTNTASMLQNFK